MLSPVSPYIVAFRMHRGLRHLYCLHSLRFRVWGKTDGAIFAVIWVVVTIMVPFWVLIIIRHLLFRVPKKGP